MTAEDLAHLLDRPPPVADGARLASVLDRARKRRARRRAALAGAVVAAGALVSAAFFAFKPADRSPVIDTAASGSAPVSQAPDAGPGAPSALRAPPPMPRSCPDPSPVPTVDEMGTYCGPPPQPGNGRGPGGTCDGRETEPPCGAGVQPDRFYPYTVPGSCDGRIRFDGRMWTSQLPPGNPIEPFPVWMRLSSSGELHFVGHGSVGFTLTRPSDPTGCRG